MGGKLQYDGDPKLWRGSPKASQLVKVNLTAGAFHDTCLSTIPTSSPTEVSCKQTISASRFKTCSICLTNHQNLELKQAHQTNPSQPILPRPRHRDFNHLRVYNLTHAQLLSNTVSPAVASHRRLLIPNSVLESPHLLATCGCASDHLNSQPTSR